MNLDGLCLIRVFSVIRLTAGRLGVEMWADDVLRHLHQVGTQLDIFTKSQASVCINKTSVLKKEMASVHLAERLANMASEQELWISYPLGAQEARVHAFHADSALRYTLSLRPFARCVAADWPLSGTNSTTGASRNWSPDGTNSEALQWSAPPDDLVQQATGVERGPDKGYTTHWYRPAAPAERHSGT